MSSSLGTHCSHSPAVPHEYKPNGTYTTVGDLKCYQTSTTASPHKGIIALYDVYGFKPQTIQGADRLAQLTGALILMPDCLGDSAPTKEIVPNTDEKKKWLADFLAGPAKVEHVVQKVQQVRNGVQEDFPQIKVWGVYGLCLGGKAALVASRWDQGNEGGKVFAAVAQAHPGRLLVEDVEKCDVPLLCLMSQKDGEPDEEEMYRQGLEKKTSAEFEVYKDMAHGWMGARGFRDGDRSVKEFDRGYATLGSFFSKHLG